MINFLSLRDINDRHVSVSYSDKEPLTARLLGNLEHGAEFNRSDLLHFARSVISAFSLAEADGRVIFSCPDCKSENIHAAAWIEANSEKIMFAGADGPRDVFYCPDCETETKRPDERIASNERSGR